MTKKTDFTTEIIEKDQEKDKKTEKLSQNITKKPEDSEGKNEDDDQNFIDKQEREELFEKVKEELKQTQEELEGILPESHHQRNLDREVGGLEQAEEMLISAEDAWDKRTEQINEINEEGAENLNSPSKSSLRKSFIHKQKQQKKREKEHLDQAQDAIEAKQSHADKLAKKRAESKGGGRGM